MAKTTRDALRSLSSVEPGDLAALQALSPEVLERALQRIRLAVRGLCRSDEVESLASLIVGRLFTGDADKAALAAVRMAEQTVRQAYAGVDSLDAWNETHGDMVETVLHTGTDRATLPHAWCPRPDAAYATTDADVVRAALDSLAGTEHGRILRDAARAYLAHGDRRCPVCSDVTTAGRRVSLAGILAHTRHLTASDSEYHALRRQTLAALRALDTAALKAEHYYPHAEGGRSGSVSLDREPALTAPGKRERERYGLPNTDAVTVWKPCEGCARVSTYAATPEDRRHILKRCADGYCGSAWPHSGTGSRLTHTEEHYAAMREPRTGEDRLAETLAAAPSRAVRRTARKRGTGTGAYGSQVGARLSR